MNIFSTKSVLELIVIILTCADVGRLLLVGSGLLMAALSSTGQQQMEKYDAPQKMSNDMDPLLTPDCQLMSIKLIFGVGGFIILELVLSFILIVKMYQDHVTSVKNCLWTELIFVIIYTVESGGLIWFFLWKNDDKGTPHTNQLELGLLVGGIVFKILIQIFGWHWCRLILMDEHNNYVMIVNQFDPHSPATDQILDPSTSTSTRAVQIVQNVEEEEAGSQGNIIMDVTDDAESCASNLAANLALILDA